MSREVEIELPSPLSSSIAGLRLRRELVSGRWLLDGWGHSIAAREWRWGERRRLLQACVDGEGNFDGDRFVAGLVALLCDPVPPSELHRIVAHLLLALLEIDGQRALPPLAVAEQALASRFGWTPGQLAQESALDLDRLLRDEPVVSTPTPTRAAMGKPEPEGPPPGWKRIVIDDG